MNENRLKYMYLIITRVLKMLPDAEISFRLDTTRWPADEDFRTKIVVHRFGKTVNINHILDSYLDTLEEPFKEDVYKSIADGLVTSICREICKEENE